MIDIIIVNYNSTDHLLRCLASLRTALDGRFPARIFVQDNASGDGVERVSCFFPEVKLHINPENIGFGKAVNQALKQGNGECVVLLNPDACVTDVFFETALAFMERYPRTGIMGPKILDNDGTLQNSARAFPTPLTAFFGRSSFLSRRFPKNPFTCRNLPSLQSDGKTPMKVDWVSGACMVVRRQAIMETGLFDERFFMYWEDADWCRRMWKQGWEVIYYPRTLVYHYVGGSSEKKCFRAALEFHKSAYRLFSKYLPSAFGFFKPLVIGGLAMRLFMVILLQLRKKSGL